MLTLQVNSERKLLMGAIQLPSFLDTTTEDIDGIANYAAENAKLFEENGFDGVFIQDVTPGNLSIDTMCNLSAITRHVKDATQDISLGSQMECDNAEAILAVAKSASCDMVRIKTYVGALLKNNGIFNGQGPEAYKYKIQNKVRASVFCDIFNLTGVPVGNLSLVQACGMALKLGVSGLIICGPDFEATLRMLMTVKEAYPKAFVICGGNATIDNVQTILAACDGVIVSSCLKNKDKTGWDPEKIRAFAANARK
jgi:predicted TIM-barrel enzyme